MALASASSSSSNSEWLYDVFLSFRGEDTRTNFIDHLYAALNRAGIRTFRDDNELERGEEIGPELLKAIEKSKYSIIVFSKNYASSTWCLDELAHIMKCRKPGGQIVLPVFYDVEPSVVRKQKSSFEEAFGGHEDRFKENTQKLKRWRDSLKEAADLKGYDVQNRHESTIIDKIVEDISNKLHPKRLKVAINPVGIDSRADVVKSLLYDESVGVCIVGICGIGGIGKTTIANEVYNSIFSKFEGSSFLEKVRENFKSKGRVYLQNQLLSDILNGKHEKIHNGDRGLKVIEERLCNIRVLLVLDDVDELEQINKILGNPHDWLSQGSRIIITTRTKDFLPSTMYRQYEVDELDEFESLQLFSINAFGQWRPAKEYLECSKSAVHYCGGIPLALEVLGSYLFGQSVDVWESKLEKLKKIPHASVQDVLEISYHSLDKMEKKIFLDIACFFIGNDKNYVISILDGCDFFAIDGINTLIKRCLLKIEFNNQLRMHDLIRDMGRQIVSQESEECGERSRVWLYEEAVELLQDETGTKAVEGLSLNLPRSDHEGVEGLSLNSPKSSHELSTEAFREMKGLRLLQLNYVNLSGSYTHISKRLRWLCWSKFSLESIPNDLHMGNVVALDMPYSSLKQVWEEEKNVKKLKFLNLSHSHKLTKTPNFERLPNLEILLLEDCPNLVEVHESIELLTKLVTLTLEDCINLQNLPNSICALKSLENLNVSGCSKLDNLPEELGNMKSLVVFGANGTAISRVPDTFAELENLKSLDLSECQLKPTPIKGPNFSGFLPVSLRELNLSYCNLSDDMIPNFLQNLPLLHRLDLSGNTFSSLPPTISLLFNLSDLRLDECRRLKSVPELPPNLTFLDASDCVELKRINPPSGYCAIKCDGLHNLDEIGGDFEVETPGEEINLNLLRELGFPEENRAKFRLCVNNGTHTETSPISPFQMSNSFGMIPLGEFIGRSLLRNPIHTIKEPNLSGFPPASLRELCLSYCNLCDDMIPDCLQNLSLLKHLDLCGNSFSSLPPTFSLLPKLKELYLVECRRLKSVPDLPPKLILLNANDCVELERINRSNGKCAIVVNGCYSLIEIGGDFKVGPTDLEIEIFGLSIKESTANNVCLCMRNNRACDRLVDASTETPHISPLQELSEKEINSIFLPGSEIPKSFCSHQSTGNSVAFNVPPLQGCKIAGFIIWTVYTRSAPLESTPKVLQFKEYSLGGYWIRILNETKRFEWSYYPTISFFNEKASEDIIWMSVWSIEGAIKDNYRRGENWEFENKLEEGDEVKVEICSVPGILVKKCGVSVICEKNDEIDFELPIIPCADSKHDTRSVEVEGYPSPEFIRRVGPWASESGVRSMHV